MFYKESGGKFELEIYEPFSSKSLGQMAPHAPVIIRTYGMCLDHCGYK